MSHDDFEGRAPKRRRMSNGKCVSRIQDYRHRHDSSSTDTSGPLALHVVPNGVSVHLHGHSRYRQLDLSSTSPTGLHNDSRSWQYGCASLYASALPQPSPPILETPLPSYSGGYEDLPYRDAQLNKSPSAISKLEITGAPTLDGAIVDDNEGVAVCFGMVSRISFFGVLYR